MTIRTRMKLISIVEIWNYLYEEDVAKFIAENNSLEGIERNLVFFHFDARY